MSKTKESERLKKLWRDSWLTNPYFIDELIRHHENQCLWQGQDPKDHETYYEEDYPEINKIFENHYGYVEPDYGE